MSVSNMSAPEELKNGICYMCSQRCPTRIHVANGKATRVEVLDTGIAEICPRGNAQLDFVYHPDRLQQPLKRSGNERNSAFIPVSWDEALDTVANEFLKVKRDYGPESVVFWVAYTKEPRPYFHRLAMAFGSPNYCTESSNCFSAKWLAEVLTYGMDYARCFSATAPVNPATKCRMVWGSSIERCHPAVWHSNMQAKDRGVKFIVVDPRRTALASMADIHLQPRPGTDGALALGMINIIISENLYDKTFVEKWTVGFDDLRKLVKDYTPNKVAEITGVPADKIMEAALLYAKQKPSNLAVGQGTTHHSNGVQCHRALILLPALTGNLDIPGGNCASPPPLPTNDITLHDRVENMSPGIGSARFPIWTSMYREFQSNLIGEQIETGKPYPLKAMLSAGLNPMYFPRSNRFVENVKKLDFVVVTDYFQTPGTQLADVVLPIASWLERHILITAPGGATLIEPAIEPVGDSWPECKIYFDLAKRLGIGAEFWNGDLESSFNEILQPSGITVDELVRQPDGTVKQPVDIRPAGYYERVGFQTPSGKVEIASATLAQHGIDPLPVYNEPAESPLSRPDVFDSFPLVLTTGAREFPFTHSQFRNVQRLRQLMPEPLVDINTADAKSRSIRTGDFVMIVSPRGSITMRANVTDGIMPGVVNAPHHWPGAANVNSITDDKNLDPISGFAPLKSSLCNVLRA
ncbi:molybdopterin-dependent oxidoreductase [Chloroflexota bacterium]